MTKRYQQYVKLIFIALLLTLSGAALAQSGRPEKGRGGGAMRERGEHPPGADIRVLSAEMRGGKVVKGAPYAAEAVMEKIQVLANGTRLTQRSTSTVYRDSEGRTRNEQSFAAMGPFATNSDQSAIVFINDPVAGIRYTLFPNSRRASKFISGNRERNAPPMPPRQPAPEGNTEALGKQMIEGIEAEGTRTTIAIPVGEIGNDQPLEIINERWYAPELQVVVLSKHSDPRLGETTYRLTKINRSEPARSLFEVPSDYSIREDSPGRPDWNKNRRRPPEQ